MTYCSVNKVRLVSGLDSNKITDSDIRDLRDDVATPEVNQDVNQKVEDEKLNTTISGEKENNIDGSNKTFYLRGTHKSELEIGDRNNDGVVDAEDVGVYRIDQDGNRVTDLNVTVVNRSIGELTVESSSGNALDGGDLYASYSLSPVNQDGYGTDFNSEGPDMLMETACAQLTAAYAFTNIEAAKLQNFSVGNVDISEQSEGMSVMMDAYRDTVKRITQSQVAQTSQNVNSVQGAFQ